MFRERRYLHIEKRSLPIFPASLHCKKESPRDDIQKDHWIHSLACKINVRLGVALISFEISHNQGPGSFANWALRVLSKSCRCFHESYGSMRYQLISWSICKWFQKRYSHEFHGQTYPRTIPANSMQFLYHWSNAWIDWNFPQYAHGWYWLRSRTLF